MNQEAEKVQIKGIALTDHIIDSRYGRIQIPQEALQQLAEQMMSAGAHDVIANHDPDQAMHASDLKAWVGDHEGNKAVFYTMEIAAQAWADFEDMRLLADAPGGFSVAFTQTIRGDAAAPVRAIGDAADFSDDEIVALADALSPDSDAARLFQLAAEPDVIRFIIEFVVAGASWDLLKAGVRQVYAALQSKSKRLNRPAAIDIYVSDDVGNRAQGRIRVESDGDVSAALEAMERIYRSLTQ
ncbi:MAG: hypothetical protein ABGZ36_23960 [Actinomycetota bacterium]